jgi:flagellum-specific ATP synthase
MKSKNITDLAIRTQIPSLASALKQINSKKIYGKIVSAQGAIFSVEGVEKHVCLGSRLSITSAAGQTVLGEVIAIGHSSVTALAFEPIEGIGAGSLARLELPGVLSVDETWLGRVLDPLGHPIDGLGSLKPGPIQRFVRSSPTPAGQRARLGPRLDLGVRALDAFATCRRGQRLGLFAASGVGKSTLLAMLAAGADCDVAVLALVGERGRELREFIEDDLGPAGLARSVIICATSDAPPLMRREAGYAAMAVAEHFATSGRHVLLLMDSVTRFAMALREIGLAAGEPPATRGYTPGVFAELPKLLERAGPREIGNPGVITALFTVLVEGDDHDEPIADSVRGILDGHVVMDRSIGERGRYPAIDVLRTLSRTVPGNLNPEERNLFLRARRILALQSEMADLVRLGAYRSGSDPELDEVLRLAPRIESMLKQSKGDRSTVEDAFAALSLAMA